MHLSDFITIDVSAPGPKSLSLTRPSPLSHCLFSVPVPCDAGLQLAAAKQQRMTARATPTHLPQMASCFMSDFPKGVLRCLWQLAVWQPREGAFPSEDDGIIISIFFHC